MTRPEDTRPIAEATHRAERFYIADHAFFAVPGGGRPPSDLLGKEEWDHLTTPPTDALLRTTDYCGSIVEDMLTQSSAWLRVIPTDRRMMPFMFEAACDAHDEFEASLFIAAHGWYRQATASLRNALEVMTHATRFAVRQDHEGYKAWREGTSEPPKFGNSVDLIGENDNVSRIEDRLGHPALFGRKPNGVMRSLHADICKYTHSQPGYVNYDLWRGSNGPVFIGGAIVNFWLDYCDTLLACYVLLKIGYPVLRLPDVVEGVPGNAGGCWHGLAESAVTEFFGEQIPDLAGAGVRRLSRSALLC